MARARIYPELTALQLLPPSVLEDTLVGARVEGGGGLGVDGHGGDCADPHPIGVYQPAADVAPVGPAVGALENASTPGRRVEGGGGLRVDGERAHSRRAQPRVDRPPVGAAVDALEDAGAGGARVKSGWRLWVDGQRADRPAFRPVGRPHVDSRLGPVEATEQ